MLEVKWSHRILSCNYILNTSDTFIKFVWLSVLNNYLSKKRNSPTVYFRLDNSQTQQH